VLSDDSAPSGDNTAGSGVAAPEPVRDDGGTSPDASPQATEFPEHLLREAGITAEQAAQQFGDAAALERAMLWHVQQVAAAGRQRTSANQLPAMNVPSGQQQVQQQQQFQGPQQFQHLQPPAAQPAQGQPTSPQVPHIKGWYEPFADKVAAMKDADGEPRFAESTVELIRQMDAHTASQFDRLTSAITPLAMRGNAAAQAMAEERAARETERVYTDMEKRFESLGEDWADTFGKGDARELYSKNQQDPGVQARQRVASTMEALANGRASMGLQPLGEDVLFQQALRAEFFPKLQEQVRQDTVAKASGRQNLQTFRPTQRKTPMPSQNQRTLAAVEAVLQKRGRTLGPPGDEVAIDGF
jgi:hypothetical protein